MQYLLKLEEVAMTLLSFYLMYRLGISLSWWLYFILFFLPDIGMLGYLVNTSVGAFTYNLFHHRGLALLIWMAGVYLAQDYLALSGLILFGHASFDRIWGYGLKYTDAFKHTHLGWLGQ